MNRRRGFTLIELVAVVVLIALVASVATVSLQEPLKNAKRKDAIERYTAFDRAIRSWTRRRGASAKIVVDIERNIASVESTTKRVPLNIPPFSGGRTVRIRGVRQPGQSDAKNELEIPFAESGISPSYALELRDALGQNQSYLLFVGVSGEVMETNDADKVMQLFQALTSRRPHTD
ncbi:MAG: prepilin-type N-terminal cleavage/methylation domain-containing protein [Planctomycetales bacterium]|nr:prepilin-type N-terminal cleavage/methylation domain-containing protein [Planctomycetales bacterium]